MAWRSPPWLRRWRLVLPEEAGIGLAPQSVANEPSLRRRSMFWPAVTSSWPAWPVEMPSSWIVRGAAVATSCSSWRSSVAISSIEAAIRRASQRSANFAACDGSARSSPGARNRAQTRGLAAERLAAGELLAQLCGAVMIRSRSWTIAALRDFHGAVARDAQQPDRLDDPVGLLRDRGRLAGQE